MPRAGAKLTAHTYVTKVGAFQVSRRPLACESFSTESLDMLDVQRRQAEIDRGLCDKEFRRKPHVKSGVWRVCHSCHSDHINTSGIVNSRPYF